MERGHELIIINLAVIYQSKQNFASTYLGGRGDSWVTEDVEIGFPPSGGRHRPTRRSVFANVTASMARGIAATPEMVRTGQAGTESLLPSTRCCQFFVLVGKLMRDL
jgi:hypothetical protein